MSTNDDINNAISAIWKDQIGQQLGSRLLFGVQKPQLDPETLAAREVQRQADSEVLRTFAVELTQLCMKHGVGFFGDMEGGVWVQHGLASLEVWPGDDRYG